MTKSKFQIKFKNNILIVILLLTTSLSLSQTTEKEKSAIQIILTTQSTAWNHADIDGYMNGYWQSDSLVFTSGGNVTRGFDSTKAKYKRKYDSKEKMGTLEFSDLEISILEENVAWVLGKWKLKRATDEPHGIFTLVMKKFNDEWKIVHDHTSASEK
ncbi:MAG: nuclear transport factor 2 family protein [Ignavibacteriales bacterium]|nr:nuclear transport factor 2 family protein [Ignavibacteriales bacterium]